MDVLDIFEVCRMQEYLVIVNRSRPAKVRRYGALITLLVSIVTNVISNRSVCQSYKSEQFLPIVPQLSNFLTKARDTLHNFVRYLDR